MDLRGTPWAGTEGVAGVLLMGVDALRDALEIAKAEEWALTRDLAELNEAIKELRKEEG